MKSYTSFLRVIAILLCFGLLTGTDPLSGGKAAEGDVYLPVVFRGVETSSGNAILVDHRQTDIHLIPDQYLDQARQFVVHFAHTSHGSQILSGLQWLADLDPKYNVDIEASGTAVLPSGLNVLRIYDGNNYPGNTYITPDLFWESADGMNHTRSVVDTGWFDISLWTWCGQMSSYSQDQIQQYLDALVQMDGEYQETQFVFFTGHTDGSQPGSTLWRNNDLVRQYVQTNNLILFDFADIESYDPDGNFYPDASDACEWCGNWCSTHPSAFECQNLPSCAHTNGLQCTLKGQAFWQLMARLAGWDGVP